MTDAPRLARTDTRDYCAAATVHLLREREARYPALVSANKVTAAEAAARLEMARAIVAQWRWIMDPADPELPPFDDYTGYFGKHAPEMRVELETAAKRQRAVADRQPGKWEAAELADLYEALAWWQGGNPDGRIISRVCADRAVARRAKTTNERVAA